MAALTVEEDRVHSADPGRCQSPCNVPLPAGLPVSVAMRWHHAHQELEDRAAPVVLPQQGCLPQGQLEALASSVTPGWLSPGPPAPSEESLMLLLLEFVLLKSRDTLSSVV